MNLCLCDWEHDYSAADGEIRCCCESVIRKISVKNEDVKCFSLSRMFSETNGTNFEYVNDDIVELVELTYTAIHEGTIRFRESRV